VLLPNVVRASKQPVKPSSISHFWVIERVKELIQLLRDFGINRREKFTGFGRSQNELLRVTSAILKAALARGRSSREIDSLIGELNASELRKSELSVSRAIDSALSELDLQTFIRGIECVIVLNRIFTGAFPESQFERVIALMPQFSDGWTSANDKSLLEDAFQCGISKSQFPARVLDLLENFAARGSVKPIIFHPHAPRKFSIADHTKILSHLMSFGYPCIEQFKNSLDLLSHSAEQIEKYVDKVLCFCSATLEEKRTITPLFAEKIQKYTASKIPQCIKTFTEIRAAATKYEEFPAEDIEFLRAVSFHGFANFENSPILTVSCHGNCSEIKLFKRMKAIFAERRRPGLRHAVPPDIRSRLPLKINDMLVCTSFGEIDGRDGFHTRDFIYPLNYKCYCVCPSPLLASTLVWLENSITERNGKPFFVVRQLDNHSHEWSGFTPDEAYSQIRSVLAEKSVKFVPPFDGHEMFGLTTALVNFVLIEQPRFAECIRYANRFFRGGFQFVSRWPVIGKFDREPERQSATVVKFKYKKKAFGDLLPPLVIDFSALLNSHADGIVVDVLGEGNEVGQFASFCERWARKREGDAP
jgi:hypothetical protein